MDNVGATLESIDNRRILWGRTIFVGIVAALSLDDSSPLPLDFGIDTTQSFITLIANNIDAFGVGATQEKE